MAKNKKNSFDINTLLIILLVLVSVAGLYFTLSTPLPTAPEIPPAKQLTVTLLGTDCENCFDPNTALEFLKSQNGLNVTQTKSLIISDSYDLANEYGITKLPAVLVQGETQNLTIENFATSLDALIFDSAPAPYYLVESQELVGLVDVIQLDAGCTDCFNMSVVSDQLGEIGVAIGDKKIVPYNSEEGQALIVKYNVSKVPTLILSDQAKEYDAINQVWEQVGTVEEDGSYVLRMVNPPYIDVLSGQKEGLVKITYLVDKTCDTCFDVTELKTVFEQGFSLVFGEEETFDVSSAQGRKMIQEYSIDLLPTIILDKSTSVYPLIGQVWEQVGTVEEDGAHIFRNVPTVANVLQKDINYKNLTSGEVLSTAEPEETLAANVTQQSTPTA